MTGPEAPRRIPTPPEFAPLMRYYGLRFTRGGGISGASYAREPEDVSAVEQLGWSVTPEVHSPAEVLDRSIAAVSRLDENAVLAAFVAGLGSAPRGRQIPISFGWARFLASAPRIADGISDCGLATRNGEDLEIDGTQELLRIALGWAWNELPWRYLPDLEAAVQEGLPTPSADDRARLAALLDLVAAQPDGTLPSTLEKEMARAGIVPGTDKYRRYGILIALSEIGALPNAVLAPSWERFTAQQDRFAIRMPGGPRSDITLPFGAWRGGLDRRWADRLRSV